MKNQVFTTQASWDFYMKIYTIFSMYSVSKYFLWENIKCRYNPNVAVLHQDRQSNLPPTPNRLLWCNRMLICPL